MKTKTFESVAVALHGPQWKRGLARDLNISERMLTYYMSGERGMPADMPERLARLLWQKSTLLAGLAKGLTG